MKTLRIHIIVLLTCLWVTTGVAFQAQSPLSQVDGKLADSLLLQATQIEGDTAQVDYLIKAAWSQVRNKPTVALQIMDTLSTYYQDTSFQHKYWVQYYYRGVIHKNLGNIKESEQNLNAYMDAMKQKGQSRRVQAGLQVLGNLYTGINDYEKAISLYIQSLEYLEQHTDSAALARVYARLGYFTSKAGDFDQALSYNSEAASLMKNQRDTSQHINILNDRGVIFEAMEKWDSMFYYYQQGLDLSYEAGDVSNKIYAHYNLGIAYKKTKEPTKAQYHYEQSLALSKASSDLTMELYSRLGLATLAFDRNDYAEAMDLLQEQDRHDATPEMIVSQEEIRSKIFAERGQHKSAYESHLRYKEAADSLAAQTNKAELLAAENNYDRKRKELEVSELALAKKEAEVQAQRAANRTLILFGGLLLALLTIAGLSYLFFLNKRKNEELKEKNKIISTALQEKEVLIKEIHHRVKNNLQIVSSLLSLQSRSTQDESASQALEDGQLRVQSMAIIHQHLYSGTNMTGVNMNDYLHNLCQQVYSSHNMNKEQVKLHLDIDQLDLDIGTVVPLGLILNELITNACKYAFPAGRSGNINISLKEEDEVLRAIISDDGVGKQGQRVGFGSKLIQAFAKKMDATVHEDHSHGLTYQLDIRNYQKV